MRIEHEFTQLSLLVLNKVSNTILTLSLFGGFVMKNSSDRSTFEMLREYCRHLGLRSFDEDFFSAANKQ